MVDEPASAPVEGAGATGERLISEAEAEIKSLIAKAQAEIDKITGGLIGNFPELAVAKQNLEQAVQWAEDHFKTREHAIG